VTQPLLQQNNAPDELVILVRMNATVSVKKVAPQL
jgi:hypothetical protein